MQVESKQAADNGFTQAQKSPYAQIRPAVKRREIVVIKSAKAPIFPAGNQQENHSVEGYRNRSKIDATA